MKLRTKYFIILALGRLRWDDKAQIKACRASTKAASANQSAVPGWAPASCPSCRLDEASQQLLDVLQQAMSPVFKTCHITISRSRRLHSQSTSTFTAI